MLVNSLMKLEDTPSFRLDSACMNNETALATSIVSQYKTDITKDIIETRTIFHPLDGGIQFVCKYKNVKLARLLLNALGKHVIRCFVNNCVLMGSAEILTLVFSEYRPLISEFVFSSGFCFASYWNLTIASMFIDSFALFPDFDLSWFCEIVFNIACDQGNTKAINLLMSRCPKHLIFPKGFSFEPKQVIKHKGVVKILNQAYRQKLSQFPQLVLV